MVKNNACMGVVSSPDPNHTRERVWSLSKDSLGFCVKVEHAAITGNRKSSAPSCACARMHILYYTAVVNRRLCSLWSDALTFRFSVLVHRTRGTSREINERVLSTHKDSMAFSCSAVSHLNRRLPNKQGSIEDPSRGTKLWQHRRITRSQNAT